MSNELKVRKYLLVGVSQTITILLFLIIIYFMYSKENIVLNPIPYTMGIGGIILVVNYIILTIIFKKTQDEVKDIEVEYLE